MSAQFKQDFAKPFAVLVVICIAAAALLGVTNALTVNVIAANEQAAMEATRQAVLPGAEGFDELDCEGMDGIISIHKETGGRGYVITAVSKGYAGDVTVTVGFDADGQIVGLQANVSGETQGVGTKAGKPEYLSQYYGDPANADGVDVITSATFSSTAVKNSVKAASAAFDAVCR